MKQVAVLICGAGPVGLVAGLRLARAGIETMVIDKESQVSNDFRASTFHPPTLEMLDELGLTQGLIAEGLVSPTWQIRQHESHDKALFDLSVLQADTPYPFRLQCEQRVLTRLADAKAQSTPNLLVQYGSELTHLDQDTQGTTATISTPNGTEQIRARYLIAADGARSICRKLTGMTFTGETYPETTILATTTFKFEEVLPELSNVNYVWCKDGTFSLLRLPSIWRCSLYSDPDETVEQALEPHAIERKLQRIFPQSQPYNVVEIRSYRIHRRLIDHYRVGRVVFAGDSAHLTSPSGGMGMNGGIHDAVNLTDKLTAILCKGASEELLDLYSRQRRPVAEEEILAQSHTNRMRMQRRDPVWRAAEMTRLQALIANPEQHREHLLKSSMIAGLARAAAVT
jgi:2-polyprenyl-6-methoxyphenol hydroxylase-like FAD-dependent oxidoreductase